MTHSRGDALQLVGMNTRTGAAAAIGIPRDSWVDIPGHGHDKINASLYFGGPQLLGRTVGNLVGIQPGLRLRDPLPVLHRDGQATSAASTCTTPSPSPTPPQAAGLQGRADPPRRVRRHGVLADPAQPARAATSTARPTSSGCCAASRPRCAPGPVGPGFIERGVLSVMQHLHTDLSGRPSCSASRRPWRRSSPSKITTCVVQGGIGDIGGGQRGVPGPGDGPPARERRPARRRDQPVLTGGAGADRPLRTGRWWVPPAGFEPAAPGTGNQCSIP